MGAIKPSLNALFFLKPFYQAFKMFKHYKNTLLVLVLLVTYSIESFSQEKSDRIFTIDFVTTPSMLFIPLKSNLPNYLISVGGKSELLGINFEWIKPSKTFNSSITQAFLTRGFSVRAFGLNWRKKPFNHATTDDISAKDIVYANCFIGGKFLIRNFERWAFNFTFGPGILVGPALQNDNVKDGVFTTFGIDVSITVSYDLSNH